MVYYCISVLFRLVGSETIANDGVAGINSRFPIAFVGALHSAHLSCQMFAFAVVVGPAIAGDILVKFSGKMGNFV